MEGVRLDRNWISCFWYDYPYFRNNNNTNEIQFKSWLHINPSNGMMVPGQKLEIEIMIFINDINLIYNELQELMPSYTIKIAHAQMSSTQLEKIILELKLI